MKQDLQIREIASGRSDQLILEAVGVDGTKTTVGMATSAALGVVELATDAEAQTGTDTERAVTPANLAAAVPTHVPAASATVQGKVELATDAETQTGTDTGRAITPANLQACTATDARKGVIELATSAETVAVTDTARAVTPYGLGAALGKLFIISFAGKNGAGACTATGLAVNDVIRSVTGLTDMGLASSSFESVVTVADQIQQSAVGDLSTKNFMALVYRPS